ncbi:hypothetical protein ACN9ON_12685, partial [Glaesserella parasuis]|uniref:hypothetical protein n=1 Tax=Glaesserella parasuis TaxID=738 RepID=UPI003B67876F
DPFDYFLMSGICAEIIRHRKTAKQLMADFDAKTLTPDYFPTRWADVYDYDRDVFEANAKDAVRRSKISVYKSAQSAPILILSPRSRGFSARET